MSIVCPHCNKEINAGYLLTTQKSKLKKLAKYAIKHFQGQRMLNFAVTHADAKNTKEKRNSN